MENSFSAVQKFDKFDLPVIEWDDLRLAFSSAIYDSKIFSPSEDMHTSKRFHLLWANNSNSPLLTAIFTMESNLMIFSTQPIFMYTVAKLMVANNTKQSRGITFLWLGRNPVQNAKNQKFIEPFKHQRINIGNCFVSKLCPKKCDRSSVIEVKRE